MKITVSAKHSCFFYSQMATRSLMWAMNDRRNAEKESNPFAVRLNRINMRSNAKSWRYYSNLANADEKL